MAGMLRGGPPKRRVCAEMGGALLGMHDPALQLKLVASKNDRVVMQTQMGDCVTLEMWSCKGCALGSAIVHVETLVGWRGIDISSLVVLLSPISDFAERTSEGGGGGKKVALGELGVFPGRHFIWPTCAVHSSDAELGARS
jgi:hypothetical protein